MLLAFQAKTGRLSPELGAMFALFMAGAAGGAWAAKPAQGSSSFSPHTLRNILLFEAGAAALALACALRPDLAQSAGTARFLIFSGGFLSGAFFAAAALKRGGEVYSWDLAGGAAGGLAAAAFAVPLAGISGALYCAAAAALAALAGGIRVSLFPSSNGSTVKE